MSYVSWMWEMAEDTGISENWIDAGLSPLEQRGEIRIPEYDLVLDDNLRSIQTLEQYANQYMATEEDRISGEYVVKWKFVTPCITTLKGTK